MIRNVKKFRALVRFTWFTLIVIWLFCFITGNYLHIVVDSGPLKSIFDFIDSHKYIDYPLSFITYYLNTIFVYYAILKQRIFSYKPILLSILIFAFWLLKVLFTNYEISNYIDFITIGILILFVPRKWYRVLIGLVFSISFVLIGSAIKGISILNYELIIQNHISISYLFMIDSILMSFIYYLYTRKEVYGNEIWFIFWKTKEMENRGNCWRNFISSCRSSWNYITSNLVQAYCSFIFSFIIYGLLLICGLVCNRPLEITISIVAFHIFRIFDEKTFHAETHIKCACVSMISFLILMRLSLPLAQSIIFQILSAYALSEIMYFVRDYIDYLEGKITLKKAVRLKDYSLEELKEKLSNLDFSDNDITAIYVYIHKDRTMLVDNILLKYSMSKSTLYRLVRKANALLQ